MRRWTTSSRSSPAICAKIPAQEIQLARLKRQAKATEDIFITLQQRKKEAQIVAAVQDPSVRIIDPAIVPFKPISPNKPLSFVIALILGLASGCYYVLLLNYLNQLKRERIRKNVRNQINGEIRQQMPEQINAIRATEKLPTLNDIMPPE